MAADEIGTLNHLKSLRADVIDPLVNRYRGDVVGSAGDSLLVAFASATDAVNCAIAWQQACGKAAEAKSHEQQMLFRIGIHLGDVIPEGGTIYGDGVNIAARLEKLAATGGLIISRAVREQIEGRLDLAFAELGPQALKNIARPVEAFEILHGRPARTSSFQPAKAQPADESASKLGIAILPFTNMSGDKEQDYFSDGITEDIITEISRFRELRVIARNSSFAFRGQNIDIAEVARKLDVQFVVEGSVRKAGNRLRITAQLIDTGADRHIWAERYDRDLDDIFAVQDEIARTVAAMSAGQVKIAVAARTSARPTESLSAYDLLLRARAMLRHYSLADLREVEALVARAIALDPEYPMAHAMMADILNTLSLYDGDMERRERAVEFARHAIKLDRDECWGHGILGYCLTFLRRVPEAGMHFERALQLNSNDVFIAMHYANSLCYAGRVDQALVLMQDVLKRDPFGHDWYWDLYCIALVAMARHSEALAAFEKVSAPAPWSYCYAAIALVNLGETVRARDLLALCRQDYPELSPEDYVRLEPYVDGNVIERLIADLKKAL